MTENLAGRGEGLAGHNRYDEIKPVIGRLFAKTATVADCIAYLRFELTEALRVLPPDAKGNKVDDWHGSACVLRAFASLFQLERALEAAARLPSVGQAPPSTAQPVKHASSNCPNCGSGDKPLTKIRGYSNVNGNWWLSMPEGECDHPWHIGAAALATPSPQAPAESRLLDTLTELLSDRELIIHAPSSEWDSRWTDVTHKLYERRENPKWAATQEQPAGSGGDNELCECGQPKNSIRHSFSTASSIDAHEFSPGSPRKVGEDGPQTFEQWWQAEGVHMVRTTHRTGYELMKEAWNAARPSSVPVGEQKQEEGV